MTRQYIGARYVPKFSDKNGGVWSNTYSYESLEIVKNGTDYYTAKRFVPVGTSLSDSYYWALTGNYNGAMQSLSDRIDANVSAINDLNDDVTELSRVAYYFGNSYAAGLGDQYGKGIYDRTKNLFKKSNLQATGGAGFLPYTGHTTTFQNLLEAVLASPNRLPNDEVTDVIVISAWGDTMGILNHGGVTGQYQTDINNAISVFATTCRNNFPNLKRIVLFLGDGRAHQQITGTSEGTCYIDAPFMTHAVFKSVARRYGVEYAGWIGWDIFMEGENLYQVDYYHPSDAGNVRLATAFKSAYTGNWRPVSKYGPFRTESEISTGTYVNGDYEITPDNIDIKIGMIETAAALTPVQYADFKLYDFSNSNQTKMAIPCIYSCIDSPSANVYISTTPNNPASFACKPTIKKASDGSMYFKAAYYNPQDTLLARTNVSALPCSYHLSNIINVT